MIESKPKILLTGATGLVGAAILRELTAKQYPTLVLTRNNLVPSLLQDAPHIQHATFQLENITADVARQIVDFSPDAIIHAAWIGTDGTNRNRPEFVYANLQSCLRLFEIGCEAGCKRWIGFGSQAEYNSGIKINITEDMPTFPDTPYGVGKLAACSLLQALCVSNKMDFLWLRLFTCYGKEYKPSYIIPYLIDCMRNDTLPVLKMPHAVWDCFHADDAANAVINVLSHEQVSGIYNLGYGQGISMGEIAMILAEYLNFSQTEELRAHIAANRMSPTYRVADITKFTKKFSWTPKIDMREGLKKCL